MKAMKVFIPLVLFLLIFSCKNNDFTIDATPSSKDSVWHTFKIKNENIRVLETNNQYFLAEDIVLSKDQFNYLSYFNAEVKPKSLVTSDFIKLWPSGKIYYTFGSNVSNTLKAEINSAMSWLSSNTPLSFALKGSSNSNYVTFEASNVNQSPVGMIGGMQVIQLTSNASASTAIHEILHAFGISHEMGRNDRDNFVTINTSNIYANKMHNFNKVGVLSSIDVGLFDARSIMMYPAFTTDSTFAKNINQPIIIPNNPNVVIAPSYYPTATDLIGINMLYGNERPYLKVTTTVEDIYVDPGSGSYEQEVTTTFSLFTNAALTTPYIKSYNVPILAMMDISKIYNGFPEPLDRSVIPLVINAGSNSVSITVRNREELDYGTTRFGEFTTVYPKTNFTGYRIQN
ncbi:hypothetical protein I6I98_03350 [Sphingobacterium multivorum]|uniref:Peptidase M12A domain-containing protein n=1 Tax=Sphingobacterium multivorum TaxID=28454 RepID=A0ABX7CQG2_SPHMU|nr:M12 family metallopeptidase [Sphingobacterium multivorum]QQT54304.1 hypothetical protein I6I98_03350 [Sphingobacterium multivorum]